MTHAGPPSPPGLPSRSIPAAVCLLVGLAVSATAQLAPVGGPLRLDAEHPARAAAEPLVLPHPDGGFLVLWEGGTPDLPAVFGRRFGTAGPLGDEIAFGAGRLDDVAAAPVAPAPGRILILVGGGSVYRARLDGTRVGDPLAYDTGRVEPRERRCTECYPVGPPEAAVAADPSGASLVVWPAAFENLAEDWAGQRFWRLLCRRFDAAGQPRGDVVFLDTAFGFIGFGAVDVVATADGSFLITAVKTYTEQSEFDDAARYRLEPDGSWAELSGAYPIWDSRIAVADQGRSLTVFTRTGWAWESSDGDCTGVYGRLTDALGDLGPELLDLPRDRSDCQLNVRVAGDAEGFVVAWETLLWSEVTGLGDRPPRNAFYGVSLRRFDLDGSPLGDPLDLRLGAAAPGELAVGAGLAAWVYPEGGRVMAQLAAIVPPGACEPGESTLCLGGPDGDRFRVDAAYRNPYAGSRGGRGFASPLSADTGAFWFFGPGNLELLVKVLDGRLVNRHYWVFAGAATTVEWWITVTDTHLREQWGGSTPPGRPATLAVTTALPRPPAVAVPEPPPVPAPGLPGLVPEVLLARRYRLRVGWQDPRSGDRGIGTGVALTPESAVFRFFGPANLELLVKVLDGRLVNGHVWVFVGSLTDVAFVLEIEDTFTGERRTYENPAFTLAGSADVVAFPVP